MASVAMAAVCTAGCGGGKSVDYQELLDTDPQVRTDAALRLGNAKAVEAVDSLIAVLDDRDEVVRVTVIQALASIGDIKAVPPVAEMIDDPLRTVRQAAMLALGEFGDPRGLVALEKMLYDGDENMRLIACRNIGRIEGQEALDLLIGTALRDEYEWVRQHAIKEVKFRRAREAIPKIESALVGEADRVRAHATKALGKLGDRSSVPVLVRALDDPYFRVRSLAAHALYEIGPDDPEILKAIQARMEVEDHQLAKVDLAWNLVRMGDDSALEILRHYLFRGEPEIVRAEAAIALGEVGDDSDIPLLKKATADKQGLVRQEAVEALRKLREQAA